ncbi:hypothetical protein IPF86_01205 [Candidatus Nomurabacteria bacterium]|nr:MAG: hypothetical protein IPF86_01205 [Candidatus Nomurabacteria bacterium]
MTNSKAQIVVTLGPVSEKADILRAMVSHQLDVVRLNFSWGDLALWAEQITFIRQLEKECGRRIPIIIDLPGPRVQENESHTYDSRALSSITSNDEEFIKFAALHAVDYVAVSFVAGPEDIKKCRGLVHGFGGRQMVIAKIERAIALLSLEQIIAEADAVMIARGDLGNEVPLEQIPFIQDRIIKKARKAGKPVIVATQMLLSMVENLTPSRAEVTDVATAILEGADAVMLSDETAKGKYPVEAVIMMEKIIIEAEKHLSGSVTFNQLKSI